MRACFRATPVCVLLAALLGGLWRPVSASHVQAGVVVDRDHAQVLLMSPGGGIEAVTIAGGATRWRSDAADLPVLVRDGRVVALRDQPERGVLPFALLDVGDGRALASRDAALPSPARVLVDERLGERFEIAAHDSDAGFGWRYVLDAVPGALLLDQRAVADGQGEATTAEARVHVELTGSVALELDTARSTVRVDAQPKPAPVAAIEQRPFANARGRQFLSGDGQHVLVSEAGEGERWQWRIHTRDGAVLGEVETDYAYRPFAVHDGVLLFVSRLRLRREGDAVEVQPATLQAIALASGVMLWSREVRDTEFRGPYPP